MARTQPELQEGISPVRADDYPRVLEVWEASVCATHHFVSEADIQFFKPVVQAALANLQSVCVRTTDGAAAGYISIAHENVEMLFVHPAWRGHGIGRRLLSYAIDVLGATTLDVNEQNEQALGFYLHMGLEVVGRSERDGFGKPYPLLHMRVTARR